MSIDFSKTRTSEVLESELARSNATGELPDMRLPGAYALAAFRFWFTLTHPEVAATLDFRAQFGKTMAILAPDLYTDEGQALQARAQEIILSDIKDLRNAPR